MRPTAPMENSGRPLSATFWRIPSLRKTLTNLTLKPSSMARQLHFGPARVPARETPEAAIDILLERGYTACEIDFEGRFWMDYDFAARFGELAREHDIVLSVHAPIAGFMGHAERGKKLNMAVGMLDHSRSEEHTSELQSRGHLV